MPVDENKKVASKYHQLNLDDVEEILTPDFVGRHTTGNTWNRDEHKNYLSKPGKKDIIHAQIAEGEMVATRFTRTDTDGNLEIEIMHLKRFRDGKICEIWEYFDWAPFK